MVLSLLFISESLRPSSHLAGGTTWEPQTTDMSKFRQISLSLNDCDGFASNDSLFVDRIAGSIKGWSSGGRVGS